jgi:cyclohexanone monooxygenase
VPTNEFQVDFLGDLIAQTYLRGVDLVEADADAQARWVQHCQDCAAQTLFDRADSWYIGANVPGKPRVVLPYTGGTIAYQAACAASAEKGFEGFVRSDAAAMSG